MSKTFQEQKCVIGINSHLSTSKKGKNIYVLSKVNVGKTILCAKEKLKKLFDRSTIKRKLFLLTLEKKIK
jgi:hypothetical protein